jgi:hypothetical protein
MIRMIKDAVVDRLRGFTPKMGTLNRDCNGCAQGSSQLWYTDHSLSILDTSTSLALLFVSLVMAPRGRKPRSPFVKHSRAVKVAIDAAEFYEDFVPKEDKAKMQELEAKVRQIREFKEDEEVEFHVGVCIPDLGCTRTKNLKFYRTLEIYWHTKTMETIGMLPNSQGLSPAKNPTRSFGDT